MHEPDSGRVSSTETSEVVEAKSNHSEELKSENTEKSVETTNTITDLTETPTTGTKNIPRYSEIRGRFPKLLEPQQTSSVNRVLFG